MCAPQPERPPFPPLSPPNLAGLSQSTSFECPASCIKLTLVICFTYGIIYVSILFSQIVPSSPSSVGYALKNLKYILIQVAEIKVYVEEASTSLDVIRKPNQMWVAASRAG